MNSFLKNRRAGACVLIVALALEAVSAVNYLAWASGLGKIDPLIAGGLGLGLLAGIVALLLGSDLLIVANAALCGCGVMQLLVSNAGSFADAYQGIVMFGDPSQVGRIVSICASALPAVLLLIVFGFMDFGKREA